MAPPPRSRSTSLGRSLVIVNVTIVVVRSGTARARTVAFRNPIATDVSAIPMSQSEPYLEVLPRAQIIPSVLASWIHPAGNRRSRRLSRLPRAPIVGTHPC